MAENDLPEPVYIIEIELDSGLYVFSTRDVEILPPSTMVYTELEGG